MVRRLIRGGSAPAGEGMAPRLRETLGKTLGLLLAGLLLTGAASLPVLAQSDTPAPTPEPSVDTPVDLPLRGTLGGPLTPAVEAPGPTDTAATEPSLPDQDDLDTVQASITLSQERIDALKAEIADMEGDRTRQNAALIAAAQRVKLAEIEVADVETRLSDLIIAELEVRGRLDGSNAEIANVLAALERISLNPPPALIVDPDDALGSARSAILLAAIVPQLRAKADSVTTDLTELTNIKAAALAEEATLRANHAVLEEEQLRIATLIAARKQGIGVRTTQLQAEEQEAMALAARAATLKELVDSLSAQVSSVTTAAAPADAALDPDLPVMSAAEIELALANSARTEPALPFRVAKGYLTVPANGVTVL